MGFLASIPILSVGSGVLGLSVSLLLITIIMALWALILMILHPLHAVMFVFAAVMEYALIYFFGFHLWFDVIAFFVFYVLIFGIYMFLLRRFIPLPKTQVELLIKLTQLRENEFLSEEEFKAAKKKLLKL